VDSVVYIYLENYCFSLGKAIAMPTLPVTLFMVKLLSIHLKMQLAIWTRLLIPLSPQLPAWREASRLTSA
jgi:hypothetical protein